MQLDSARQEKRNWRLSKSLAAPPPGQAGSLFLLHPINGRSVGQPRGPGGSRDRESAPPSPLTGGPSLKISRRPTMAAQSSPVAGRIPGKINHYRVKILTHDDARQYQTVLRAAHPIDAALAAMRRLGLDRSEEHTSELQSQSNLV